jgi:hypothetical protein
MVPGCLPGAAPGGDSGVVEQQVHLAKCTQRFSSQGLNVVPFGNVGPDGQHGGAGGLHVRFRAGESVLFHIGENDLHPLVGAPVRNGPPDAARGAGDNRDLSFEILHFTSFPDTGTVPRWDGKVALKMK